MSNTINETQKFFEIAVPNITESNQNVQYGVHFEEFREMLDEMSIPKYQKELEILAEYVKILAEALKKDKEVKVIIKDRKAMLDAISDQLVTGTGVGYMLGFDVIGALNEVNRSNFSKLVNGLPIFNEFGKIAKGSSYTSPFLDSFVGENPVA